MKRERKTTTKHCITENESKITANPVSCREKEEEKKRQRKTWNRSNHNDHTLQMSDGNIKRKKEGSGDSSKSNNYQKHLPAALALAATRLCALHAVHCLQKTEG